MCIWNTVSTLSSHRQLDATLSSQEHSNGLAAALEDGYAITPHHAVQTNMVFLRIDAAARDSLHRQGFSFYTIEDEVDGQLVRLVTSHATQPHDVDRLAEAIGQLICDGTGRSG